MPPKSFHSLHIHVSSHESKADLFDDGNPSISADAKPDESGQPSEALVCHEPLAFLFQRFLKVESWSVSQTFKVCHF